MRKYRTLNEVTVEYYREHPEEVDEFLKVAFEEYALDSDTEALFSALRIASEAKDISISPKGIIGTDVQKAWSETSHAQLTDLSTIMQALGYRLVPEKLHSQAS